MGRWRGFGAPGIGGDICGAFREGAHFSAGCLHYRRRNLKIVFECVFLEENKNDFLSLFRVFIMCKKFFFVISSSQDTCITYVEMLIKMEENKQFYHFFGYVIDFGGEGYNCFTNYLNNSSFENLLRSQNFISLKIKCLPFKCR